MKKLNCVFINILLIFIVLFLVEIYCFVSHICYDWAHIDNKNPFVTYFKYYNRTHESGFKFREQHAKDVFLSNHYSSIGANPEFNLFRPIENKDREKSIVIFGCSYAYGLYLNNEQTFSHYLGKNLQDYKIYNRALSGLSTSHILFQLRNHSELDFKKPKYFIYVFMVDHLYRNDICGLTRLYPFYEFKNNEFVLEKYSWKYIQNPTLSHFKHMHREYRYARLKDSNNPQNSNYKTIIYTKEMIKAIKKEILEKYGEDTKFIIFRYDEGFIEGYNWMFEELKAEGLEVISVKDLSDKPFLSNEDGLLDRGHPTSEDWKEVTTLFTEYMKKKGYFK